jgi:hypothetical protein
MSENEVGLMKLEIIILLYVAVLATGAVVAHVFPSQSAELVNLLLPTKGDLRSQAFVYRMTLFILASGFFVILFLVICFIGLKGMTADQMRRIHWLYFAVAVVALPFGWTGFQDIALCQVCWTANDYFYLLVTVFYFGTLHLWVQAIVLKFFR